MTIEDFAKTIQSMGGTAYIVGGFVRDEIMNISSHDCDLMITGIKEDDFVKKFPNANPTGLSFPVFRLFIGGEEMEVAFARKERKVSEGHNGFEVFFSPEVTVEEDLERRDIRMNSIAKNILTKEIIDPFNGVKDIQNKIINITSKKHFSEDPLRVLRVARQASKFNFDISEETKQILTQTADSLVELPLERIFGEMEKALETKKPSTFFRILKEVGALKFAFPWLNKLIGQTQSKQWHPEGDAFEHSMLVLDKVSMQTKDVKLRFCALYHDIGKAVTPKEKLPKHLGHDFEGLKIIDSLPFVIPKDWRNRARAVAELHMKVRTIKKPVKKVQLFNRLKQANLSVDEFKIIVSADSINGDEDVPAWLTQETFDKVFLPIEIPNNLNPKKDGTKIKEFVLSVRSKRIG